MTQIDYTAFEEHYRTHGWVRFDLAQTGTILAIRDMLEAKLRELVGAPNATLARYHEFVPDDRHEDIQWQLVNAFWSAQGSIAIARANLPLFRVIIGVDLHVQNKPYLRVARPGRRDDNIDHHRDTFYGQSMYEVTIHLPFTALDARGALKFGSGSHIRSEAHYGIVPTEHAAWEKGSRKHLMGFPYAPKRITADISRELVSVPLTLGQAVMFPPSTIHGQQVNEMETTRVSIDFRLVNSFAPIKIRQELGSRGYVPLCESAVSEIARRYLAANG